MTDPAAARGLTIQTPADPMARASRQAVRCSNVAALVERNPGNQDIREEVRELINPDFRTTLDEALAGVQAELALPDDREKDELVVELTQAIRLLGGQMSAAHRDEWIDAAANELEPFPWSLIQPAIADARRTVRASWDFVPTVIAAIREPLAKLTSEAEGIAELIEIAEG